MPVRDNFPAVFERMRGILEPHAPPLQIEVDASDNYSLVAPPQARYPQYPRGLPFGSVRIGKRYVSYHLMPVYAFPELLDGASPRLRQRMQGKSCFNFTRLDDEIVAALGEVTAAGLERYRREGLL
jgi:hypothetical protein